MLDLQRQGYQATIPFIKTDRGAFEVIFSIRDGPEAVKLPYGVRAAISVHNGADGKGVLDNCTVSHVDNTVSYIPTPDALSVAGCVACNLHLYDERGAKIGAPTFVFQISDTEGDVTEQELEAALRANPSWGLILSAEENAKKVADAAELVRNLGVGLQFEPSADGTYYIVTGPGTVEGNEISIPDYYLGLPVKEVAAKAFYGNPNVKQIFVGSNVDYVGGGAFMVDNLLSLVFKRAPTEAEKEVADGGEWGYYGLCEAHGGSEEYYIVCLNGATENCAEIYTRHSGETCILGDEAHTLGEDFALNWSVYL